MAFPKLCFTEHQPHRRKLLSLLLKEFRISANTENDAYRIPTWDIQNIPYWIKFRRLGEIVDKF